MIHFTLALFELAGLIASTLLWSALAPLAIVASLFGGFFLLRRNRRR